MSVGSPGYMDILADNLGC